MQILLASGSPRRKELFSYLGVEFKICVPQIEENITDGEGPEEFCSRVSRDKAFTVAQHNRDALVIAADTIVVVDDTILGKPQDEKQAFEYLSLLQDNIHIVFTGYTIMHADKIKTRVIQSKVSFKPMSDEEIRWYISSGEPMDKAGAYALQGIGALFVDTIEGSFTNVIGLPLSDLYNDLKEFGLIIHRT